MNLHENRPLRDSVRVLTVKFSLVLALCAGAPGFTRTSRAQAATTTEPKSAERAVYDNDELFNQLSGAARTRAEMKFGRKVPPGAKPSPVVPAVGGEKGPGPGGPQPLSALSNTLVNNPGEDATPQDTQSETTLILGPGSIVLSGFNDSAFFNGTTSFKFTGWSQSTDGGLTWTDKGMLPTNPDGDAGDPVMAYSVKTGTILFSTLSLRISQDLVIFRSIDNGATFTGPVQGAPGFTATTGNQDKEWITCDNFPGTGQGNFYMFWRNFGSPGGMTFTKSTDDGVTWGPSGGTVLLPSSGQGAQVVVGADHSVYCFWYDTMTAPYRILVRKSTDFGTTFAASVPVTTFISTGVNGDLNLGGFRSSTFPQVVVNPVSGNLYIVYPDSTTPSVGGDRGNIFFRQSTDGGATWSAAVRVNDDLTTRAQFSPGIAVKPDGSGLAVSWYDRRRDPADALIERWAGTATISGNTVTFGPNFRISPQFPAVFGVDPVVNGIYMGDYDQMAADNTFFYTTWGDNRDQSTAVPSRKNANVRFAKFTIAGPGPILDSDSVVITGGNGNGLIDPNECDNIQIVLRNYGSSAATGVSVTLSTVTPGVTIFQGTSAYPNIAVGATGANITPFRISTSPSYVCGTPVVLAINITYAGGSDAGSATLPSAGAGYTMTSSGGASIVPGTTDVGNHFDDGTTTIALPFTYTFYGVNYVTAAVSSNGNLQFGTTSTAYSNGCLPSSSFGDAILPHWDDLRTDAVGSGIFTSISGVAPNRIFNIEWRATYFASGLALNFETRLYEGQQRLDLIYGNLNGTGASATVGVQHGTTSANQFECNSGGLSSGLQVTFQASACLDGGGVCGPPAPTILTPARSGNNFTFSFATVSGFTYDVQYKDSLTDPTWQLLQSFVGDGTVKIVTVPISAASQRFYRLFVH